MLSVSEARANRQAETAASGPLRGASSSGIFVIQGNTFIVEGASVEGVFAIVAGAVLLSRVTQDGKRHVLGILGPGDLVGLTSGDLYDCSVEAIVNSTVRRVDLRSLDHGLESQIIVQLQKQLEASRTHAILLQRRSAEEKLASFILSLPDAYRSSASGSPGSAERIMLSLADTADYLSLRMETVCRVLARFRRRGLIAMRARGSLTIEDGQQLQAIANPCD